MIRGIVENGRVVALDPAPWPNGTPVRIDADLTVDEESVQPNDPESIAEWIAWMRSLEPLELTEDETARWQADRDRRKAEEKANFALEFERLRGMWQ
jgi:hypothetical protein